MKLFLAVLFMFSYMWCSDTPSSTASVKTIRYYRYDPYGKTVMYKRGRPVVYNAVVKKSWIKYIYET